MEEISLNRIIVTGIIALLVSIFVYIVAINNNMQWIKDCDKKCGYNNWVARYQLWNTEQVVTDQVMFTAEEANIWSFPTIAQYWCTCTNCSTISHPYGNSGFWYQQMLRFCE